MDNTQVQSIRKESTLSAKNMAIIGLMSALAFILMYVHFPIKFLGFLELELSDVPAVFTGLVCGPVAGVFVELVKNLLHLMSTSTAGVGEIANFIMSACYVLGISFVFKYSKSKKSMLLGFVVGTLCLTISGAIVNYFITIPLYVNLYFGGSEQGLYAMTSAMIPAIKDLKTLIILGFTPFNIVKGIIASIVSYIAYKALHSRLA